jgi:leucyl aminopeptidase
MSSIASIQLASKEPFHYQAILLFTDENRPEAVGNQPAWLKEAFENGSQVQVLAQGDQRWILVRTDGKTDALSLEKVRKLGAETCNLLSTWKTHKAEVQAWNLPAELVLAYAEGLALASYHFDKYKTKAEKGLKEIHLHGEHLDKKAVKSLNAIVEAVALTRNLVNEPASVLTAKKLSEYFEKTGKDAGFEVEVLGKNKIQSLKMGGLLGVNQGSDLPPTFNILEYKAKHAKNEKPIILVGKGVVYDTGGHSLKTSAGMEAMKCDMAGAATVLGVMKAAAELELPLHIIGLVPATDNRISAAALSPGDIITMSDGTTVEVLNTDAEGRLILADALVFAKKYEPEVVFDFATLTGAAARAIGKEGYVCMGTVSAEVKAQLAASQEATYERGVEFPLWDEYQGQLKSDVADLKNIGGAEAGAITAGKFLQHFTSYTWMHFDIAGPAFYEGAPVGYIPKGGTGFCVRLIVDFLKNRSL